MTISLETLPVADENPPGAGHGWPSPFVAPLLWAVGWVLFSHLECGFAMIPLVIGTVFFYLGRRFFGPQRQALLWLLSVLAAHAGWGWKGGILIMMGRHINAQQARVLVELMVYTCFVGWLAIWPGKIPLYVLLLYTVCSLLINILALPPVEIDIRVNRALLLHIALRLMALRFFLQALPEKKSSAPDVL